jgi:aryl-alcohol dehydrogenase-like predicted oxidoreductase
VSLERISRREALFYLLAAGLAPSFLVRGKNLIGEAHADILEKIEMRYATIPGFAQPLSRLVQGTAAIVENEDWRKYLDQIRAYGCNTFDSAREYNNGKPEEALGSWMYKRKIRKEVVIITKAGHSSGNISRLNHKDLEQDIHQSLKALKTDYLDILLLHRDDVNIPVDSIIESLNNFKKLGKILAFGGSNWSASRIAEAQRYSKKANLDGFSLSSPQWSLTEWQVPPWPGCVSISGPEGAADRKWYKKEKFPVLAWSSLSGGAFTKKLKNQSVNLNEYDRIVQKTYGGKKNELRYHRAHELAEKLNKDVYQIALAYLYSQPINTFAIVGTSKAQHFKSNMQALHFKLSENQIDWLDLKTNTLKGS